MNELKGALESTIHMQRYRFFEGCLMVIWIRLEDVTSLWNVTHQFI